MPASFRPLRAGEPVGVVALSGPVDRERLDEGRRVLEGWGHPVVQAPNVGASTGYLAGDDQARLDGLNAVLDRGARVILAARGGYGVTRLLHRLPWPRLVGEQVCFVGFSDLTPLLNRLPEIGGAAQVHGPMAAAGLSRSANARRLRAVLSGELVGRSLFRVPPGAVIREGCATGPSAGWTLALLAAVAGTPWAPDLKGRVLLLEEVNEPVYRIDRMLTQVAASGMFRGVKALITGSLRGCGRADRRSEAWRRLAIEAVADTVPIVDGLRFGHTALNLAFPVGAAVSLDTSRGELTWSEVG